MLVSGGDVHSIVYGACKQNHAQLFFEFLDGSRRWRLLDLQPLSGACKVRLFSNSQKTTAVSSFRGSLAS
jgi:hypothetical protein